MSLIKSKQEKEFEKRMAIKKTINEMNKQIDKLTEAEKTYLSLAKKAKAEGLSNQYSLSISGLRSTIAQKKRVQEMLLNFEIMNQSKDVALMTSAFLKGMGSLSKDMVKLCDEKQFAKVANEFGKAQVASEMQEERLEMFLENSKESFDSLSKSQAGDAGENLELDEIVEAELNRDVASDDLESEIAAIEKKLSEKLN